MSLEGAVSHGASNICSSSATRLLLLPPALILGVATQESHPFHGPIPTPNRINLPFLELLRHPSSAHSLRPLRPTNRPSGPFNTLEICLFRQFREPKHGALEVGFLSVLLQFPRPLNRINRLTKLEL